MMKEKFLLFFHNHFNRRHVSDMLFSIWGIFNSFFYSERKRMFDMHPLAFLYAYERISEIKK